MLRWSVETLSRSWAEQGYESEREYLEAQGHNRGCYLVVGDWMNAADEDVRDWWCRHSIPHRARLLLGHLLRREKVARHYVDVHSQYLRQVVRLYNSPMFALPRLVAFYERYGLSRSEMAARLRMTTYQLRLELAKAAPKEPRVQIGLHEAGKSLSGALMRF